MYSTLPNFRLTHDIPYDPATAVCFCSVCGKALFAVNALADGPHRAYCPDCLNGVRIAPLYEVAMHELVRCLDRLDIPHNEPEKLHDGFALRFPWCGGDVICHGGSYGHEHGYLETYGFQMDEGDVTGWLTPLRAVEIVLHEWNEHHKAKRAE